MKKDLQGQIKKLEQAIWTIVFFMVVLFSSFAIAFYGLSQQVKNLMF